MVGGTTIPSFYSAWRIMRALKVSVRNVPPTQRVFVMGVKMMRPIRVVHEVRQVGGAKTGR
jgi:hypothetical protein